MSDELNAFERLDADMPLPLDLRALEDRVIDDSLVWEARVPPADRLMRFARELPGSSSQEDESAAGGGPGPRPGAAPERIRHRAAPGHAPRRHALAAYAAAFGLMTLTTLLLVQLASFRMVGTSVPPQRAEATVTQNGTTPTATSDAETTPTVSPTSTALDGQVGGTGGAGPTNSTPVVMTQVTAVSVTVHRADGTGPCSQGVPLTATVSVTLVGNTGSGIVSFLWASDDNSLPPNSTDLSYATGDTTKTANFTLVVPSADGDGTSHWLGVQVTNPNVLDSPHATFSFTCPVILTSISGSVSPASWTGTCTGTDTQVFTFNFVVPATWGPNTTATWTVTASNWFQFTNGLWHPSSGTSYLDESFGDVGGPPTRPIPYVFDYYALPASAPNGDYSFQLTVDGPNNSSVTQTLHVTKNCA